MNPGPIILPNTRSGKKLKTKSLAKDLSKRKRSKKSETSAKVDPSPQVDSKNFPELGAANPRDQSKSKSIFGSKQQDEPNNRAGSKSKSKRRMESEKEDNESKPNDTEEEEQTQQQPREFKAPQPKPYKNGVSVLDMLDRSYKMMKYEFESDPCSPRCKNLKVDKMIGKFSESTLFFIFYYQQGTYNQILAAEELKKKNWSYNTKFQTWFRDSEVVDKSTVHRPVEKLYFDFGPDWTTKRVKINSRQ